MGVRKQANRLTKLLPEWAWNYSKRNPINNYNPTREPEQRKEPVPTVYSLFNYDETSLEEKKLTAQEACAFVRDEKRVTWINIDGLNKAEVENICNSYGIHYLVAEDILSIGQRAKMDEIGDIIFCLLPMLYYNIDTGQIESEQVSLVLGADFVLSFQEDATRDVFNPLREKLRAGNLKLRQSPADYLCYSLIDIIVDSYFSIIEKLNDSIEKLEDSLLQQKEKAALGKISILRREVMVLKRAIGPVRDLVNGFLRSESPLIESRYEKYYKNVLDHITQANDYVENHRDMLINLQDLSMSQINTRMNEVMKVFTLLATLMAPATVIGGIFGMNFDVIPLSHQQAGFYITVGLMLIIPALMMIWFKRNGWF